MSSSKQASAETLSRILLIQNMIGQLPDEQNISNFVCAGLRDLPGIDEVWYKKKEPSDVDETKIRHDLHQFPVSIDQAHYYGDYIIRVSDSKQFTLYSSYIHNLSFMVAVILDNRRQAELLSSEKLQLEAAVKERTTDLLQSNQKLLDEITERELIEQALTESKDLLDSAINNAPIGMVLVTPNGAFYRVNQALCEITGYSEAELLKMSFNDITHPDDHQIGVDAVRRLLSGLSHKEQIEKRYIHKNGVPIDVFINTTILRKNTGTPLYFFTQIQDITLSKEAEQKLKDSEKRLSDQLAELNYLYRSTPVGICLVSSDLRFIRINQAMADINGKPISEHLNRTIREVIPEVASQVEPIYQQVINTGQPIENFELHGGTQDDLHLERDWLACYYPVLSNDGTLLGVGTTVQDVTERKRTAEIMIQTEKMMSVGGLAAGMAHEINNPLSVILQSAQNITRFLSPELPKNQELAQQLGVDLQQMNAYLEARHVFSFIEGMQEAAKRASKIVKDMLLFSRRSESRKASTNLSELIEQTLDLAAADYDLKKRYDFKNFKILREYDSELQPVFCTQTEIQQVFLNLLRNSAQAIGSQDERTEDPTVTVRTINEGNMARLEVEDNGPGMEEQVRKRVFEPFFTTKDVGSGTGLGLSVSYFIITNNHKGQIAVESMPGKGAKFIIHLPFT
ncbi:MAG: PAS domain S-box protein [SAR324 cluster bacterium]|nr:PAS domain S-box protein [SAR324 cluster bacterium]